MRTRLRAAELKAEAAVEAEASLRMDMQRDMASLAQDMQALMSRLKQSEQDLDTERAERRRLEVMLSQRGGISPQPNVAQYNARTSSPSACSDPKCQQDGSDSATSNGILPSSLDETEQIHCGDDIDVLSRLATQVSPEEDEIPAAVSAEDPSFDHFADAGIAARDETLERWLERLGIEQYCQILRDHGAISVASLADMSSAALGELLSECAVKRGHIKKIEKGLLAHRALARFDESHSAEARPPRDIRRLNWQLEGAIAAMDELREMKEDCESNAQEIDAIAMASAAIEDTTTGLATAASSRDQDQPSAAGS
jgi:hypothetical protein